jgi:hypothetical protein
VSSTKVVSETEAMQICHDSLEGLTREEQVRVLGWLHDKLGLGPLTPPRTPAQSSAAPPGGLPPPAALPGDITPKAFLALKKPKTAAERVTCLAFYLQTYRATQYFKTIEITKLNREAAQPPLANATVAMDHAARHFNYLAAVGGGKKQMTVRGEAFVNALPNREAVTAALEEHKLGPSRKKSKKAVPPRAKS